MVLNFWNTVEGSNIRRILQCFTHDPKAHYRITLRDVEIWIRTRDTSPWQSGALHISSEPLLFKHYWTRKNVGKSPTFHVLIWVLPLTSDHHCLITIACKTSPVSRNCRYSNKYQLILLKQPTLRILVLLSLLSQDFDTFYALPMWAICK